MDDYLKVTQKLVYVTSHLDTMEACAALIGAFAAVAQAKASPVECHAMAASLNELIVHLESGTIKEYFERE